MFYFFPGHFHHPPSASPVTCHVGVFVFVVLVFSFFFYYLATGESRAHGETRSLQWPPSIDALFGTHALGATLIVLREWLKLVAIILADGLAPGLFAPKYCTTGC